MKQRVVALFNDHSAAQKAVEQLLATGITRDSIAITREHGSAAGTHENESKDEHGVSRFFKSIFSSNDDKEQSETSDAVRVSVQVQSAAETQTTVNLLQDYGAVYVKENTEHNNQQEKEFNTNENAYRNAPAQRNLNDDDRSRQEDRSAVQANNPVDENMHLREGSNRNEQNPYDVAMQESGLQHFKEGTIELTERKEVPLVHKEPRVVEEIRIQKEMEEREETVHDTVRSTDLQVQNLEEEDTRNVKEVGYDTDFKIQEPYDNTGDNYNMNRRNLADNEQDDLYNRKTRGDGDPLFGA